MSASTESLLARRSRWAWGGGLAVLLAAPFIGLYPIFMMKALCFAIFSLAFGGTATRKGSRRGRGCSRGRLRVLGL